MIDMQMLSKEISYALRHAPWEYELEMDEEGWVSLEQLYDSLKNSEKWKDIQIEYFQKMIDKSGKKRHEIINGKIRAFYGHSIPMKIQKKEGVPPDILYHGTTRVFLKSIIKNGLLAQSRQYVHLSQDIETASLVGKRRDGAPILLKINAKDAYEDSIKFYYGNEKVWLADHVPVIYITII